MLYHGLNTELNGHFTFLVIDSCHTVSLALFFFPKWYVQVHQSKSLLRVFKNQQKLWKKNQVDAVFEN